MLRANRLLSPAALSDARWARPIVIKSPHLCDLAASRSETCRADVDQGTGFPFKPPASARCEVIDHHPAPSRFLLLGTVLPSGQPRHISATATTKSDCRATRPDSSRVTLVSQLVAAMLGQPKMRNGGHVARPLSSKAPCARLSAQELKSSLSQSIMKRSEA